jgi:2-phosphosulfolactate phosphatase
MPHRIDVCYLPAEIDSARLPEYSVAVIDLLRASTTICHALSNGARDVIPVATPAKAQELRNSIGKAGVLLCGERKGVLIDGFDLGNSPSEYQPLVVADKTLLYSSSNGSAALVAAQGAARMCMAGLVNATAVLEWLGQGETDVLLVCAGKLGTFSAEDAACAGFLASGLIEAGYRIGNDAARASLSWIEMAAGDWVSFLKSTDHGRYLSELGFVADLAVAAALDSHSVVPQWQGTRLALTAPQVEA